MDIRECEVPGDKPKHSTHGLIGPVIIVVVALLFPTAERRTAFSRYIGVGALLG